MIRHRFLDPEAPAEVIAQKLCQSGWEISIRSVQRVIEEFGLQKKLYQCRPKGELKIETPRTKKRTRTEPCDPASLERGVRQLLADKASGNPIKCRAAKKDPTSSLPNAPERHPAITASGPFFPRRIGMKSIPSRSITFGNHFVVEEVKVFHGEAQMAEAGTTAV